MVQSGSKPLPGPQGMFFDHPAPPERIFELFSKVEISISKSSFFKSKPCMKNLLVEKLDMVPYFTPLASLEIKSKNEK